MKTALILVDLQNDYFPGGSMELEGMNAAGAKAAQLLGFFRKNKWPTFHIQHVSIQKGATFFLPDTEGVKIHESIKPLPDDVVVQKHYPNSFRDTDLYEHLSAAAIQRVVICICVSMRPPGQLRIWDLAAWSFMTGVQPEISSLRGEPYWQKTSMDLSCPP
jgi:nicotinamidase-related amidase